MCVLVKNTIGICGTRTNTEKIPMNPSGIIVNVIKLSTRFVPTSNHGAHRESIATILEPGKGTVKAIEEEREKKRVKKCNYGRRKREEKRNLVIGEISGMSSRQHVKITK